MRLTVIATQQEVFSSTQGISWAEKNWRRYIILAALISPRLFLSHSYPASGLLGVLSFDAS